MGKKVIDVAQNNSMIFEIDSEKLDEILNDLKKL
jgi:hypothetical protein